MFNLLRHADNVRDLRAAGLPAVKSSLRFNRYPGIGSTTTNLTRPQGFAVASNAPSVRVDRLSNGGAVVTVRRNASFGLLLDDRDLAGMERVGERILERMKAQSKGPLGYGDLRRLNHPYGRGQARNRRSGKMVNRGKLGAIGQTSGVRGSVQNLAVVNQHRTSGGFADSWKFDMELDSGGVTLKFINDSEVASFLALGTPKMRAHGPFTSVPIQFASQINSEWQKTIRAAYRRKAVESDLLASMGIL